MDPCNASYYNETTLSTSAECGNCCEDRLCLVCAREWAGCVEKRNITNNEVGFGDIAFLSKWYDIEKYLGITKYLYITLLYKNNLIKDGRLYVLQKTSVYLYIYLNITEYKILCRCTVTTALHCIKQSH